MITGGFAGSLDDASPGNEPERRDKSQYNLFHPTPLELLRSYSTDRPSQSLGPYTVDAGHFYFETSVLSYLFDESADGSTARQWNVVPINFRIGLTNNIELDLAYGDYFHLRIHDHAANQTKTQSGFGDFIVQSKINLLGDDGGKIALGLIPFLKFPTNTNDLGNDSIEGGIGIPLQVALPAGFALALETGVNFIRNSNDDGYRPAFINALLLSHTLFTDRLTVYGEFYSVVTGDSDSTLAGFIDTGLVYQIRPNAEVDFGCNFGVTEAAPDYQPFAGFSFRF
jgi:outer membrane putative beta-barrel porin/alpha-amylase